jgi:hypothetical protein
MNLFVGEGWKNKDGKVYSYSKIEGKDKLLVPKFDSLIKHSSFKNRNVARVVIGAYYVNLNNAHVKNENLYISTWHDTIVDLVEKVRKSEKTKKYDLLEL